MWGIPILFIYRGYVKMDEKEKTDVKRSFKTPHFIFTVGFLIIGLFIAQLGNLLSLIVIKHIGTIILIIGGVVSIGDMWPRSKLKSMSVPLFLAVAIYFLNS